MRLTDLRLPLFTRGELVELLLFSALNGVISGLGALGAYNFLGRMAGIVTPLQLLELAHPNQPLLRRLMQEAPGTHHHSVVVSNLCENAAEAIGADSLLVRVGAYYHDVGKIIRPYFFTDNQHNRANVHESLDPKTSAALICDHVTEGMRLARQYGLPQQIVDFIPQHHGTSVIKYFYQQALQRDDTVSIDDYRYPGPKPQSKEAAILMLADGCEATVRSREQAGLLRPIRPEDEAQELDADARGRGQTIEEVVDQSLQDRMRSGELDESMLTLRDLNLIKQSFVKTLQGIYHPRVDYPRLVKAK
jgi:putative nucleotidyltransferase with HDIG domain